MRIGIIYHNEGGVEYHRLLKPGQLLHESGHDVTLCKGASQEMFGMFDVVIFNRKLNIVKQKEFIKELQRHGAYVICDIDDYWILPKTHVLYKYYQQIRKQHIEALTYSDEVWTTHEHLKGYVTKLNDNCFVIPNAIDPREPQWQPKKTYGTRIGWAGSPAHFDDLKLTVDHWGDTIPVICGFNKDEPEWIRIADMLKGDYITGMSVYEYGYLYDQFDIAIAPLLVNRFSVCKSNLKIVEAGMKGLPIFVQNTHPYTDEVKGIFRVDNWATSLQAASAMDAETVKGLGAELRRYVLDNYDLQRINEIRRQRVA